MVKYFNKIAKIKTRKKFFLKIETIMILKINKDCRLSHML